MASMTQAGEEKAFVRMSEPFDVEKSKEGGTTGGELLDWLGRPATKKHGGRKTTVFILANQGLWNIANFAVATNLVIYFMMVLQMSNATAANNVTNWFGTMWLTTLLGGFLGDSYLGRLWTCAVFQVVHIVGLVLLSLSVTLDTLKPPVCAGYGAVDCPKPSTVKVSVFFVAIYITAVGSGGYLPAFQALGGDQFDSERRRTTFFGWLFLFTNIGAVLANTVFVYIESQGKWALGYWLATGVGILSFMLFCVGLPTYRQFRPGGNPFVRAAQVVTAMLRKWRVDVPNDEAELYESSEGELTRQGLRKMPRTCKFRFLEKAATIVAGEEGATDRWKLCSVTQVEEVKCLCRMLPIWMGAILFAMVFSQISTLFVEQAVVMDRHVLGITIPPASMSVFTVGSIFAFTLLYPRVFVPLARAVTGRQEGITHLQRLGVGQVMTAVGIAVAALVEAKRLRAIRTPAAHRLSVLWLLPQHVILGAAQVFGIVGAMDFFYTEAPHALRGLVGSLSLANVAIGSYGSTVLVSVVTRLSTTGGRPGWIPPNLNVGHVDYFYWLLTGITILNIAFYIAATNYYRSASVSACPSVNNPPPPTLNATVVHPSESPLSLLHSVT